MAQITNCLKLISRINEGDQDSLISRIDELQALGVPAQRAQVQAAIDVLARLQRDAGGIQRSAKRSAGRSEEDIVAARADGWSIADNDLPSREAAERIVKLRTKGNSVVMPMDAWQDVEVRVVESDNPGLWAIEMRKPKIARSAKRDITETPEFKAWFGDSKVVDADGKPLVVYHGTGRDVSAFDRSKIGSATDEGFLGDGFYFTDSKRAASAFAKGDGGNVIPAYLSIKNPYYADGLLPDYMDAQYLLDAGFDGVIYETDGSGDYSEYVALKPEQIKSAVGNNGKFDPANPDIARSAKRDVTETPEFKRWFGDSKVVDADGKPLVVYHGTDAEFNVFQPSSDGVYGHGAYLTKYSGDASTYGRNVMPVYVSLQNPYVATPGEARRARKDGGSRAWSRAIQDKGHDGIVLQDMSVVVAFRPEQIKSATGNNGNFDPSNPDITRSAKRSQYTWAEREDTPDGPVLRGDGFYLLPQREIAQDDFGNGGFGDSGLLGHAERVVPNTRTFAFRIVSDEGKLAGTLVSDVDDSGALRSIHDIEIVAKQSGLGSKIVATIAANTSEPIKIQDITNEADPFWTRIGVGYKDPYGDAILDWEDVAQYVGSRAASRVDQDWLFAQDGSRGLSPDSYEVRELSDEELEGIKFSRARGKQDPQDSAIEANLDAQSKDQSYEAAKSGDMKAALELVSRVMSSDAEDKVRRMIGDSKPIVVSVRAKEAAGRNKIPLATAIELGDRLGLEVDTKIVQSAGAKPKFTGDVVRGANYLIADDTLAQSDAIAQLGTYIKSNGGRVVGAFALSGRQYTAKAAIESGAQDQARQSAKRDVTDTPEFKRWSDNAQLISSAEAESHEFRTGEKVVLEAYHGTARGDRVGDTFKRSRATSGPMAFFTSSPELASNYANNKSDTSRANEDNSYANWFKYKPKGQRSTVDIARAWAFLDAETKRRIAERMPDIREDDDGDIIYEEGGGDIGSYEWNLKQTQSRFDRVGNPLAAAVEAWLNSGTIFNREQDFMRVLQLAGFPMSEVEYDSPSDSFPFVYKTYVKMGNPLVTSDIPTSVDDALRDAAARDRSRPKYESGADMWDKNTRTLKQWAESYFSPENTYVWTSIPDKVTDLLESLGYDGIIDYSGKGGGLAHPVYIPFRENQVKSAIGNNGKFGETKNILRSAARGVTETPEFKSWFSDSKVVDAQGRPLVVYHGTQGSGIVLQDKRAVFFTSSPAVASSYANGGDGLVQPAYLRLSNPLEVDAMGATSMSLPFGGMRVGMPYLVKEAKRLKRDGVIVRNVEDMVSGMVGDYFIAIGKSQIKSAIGNNGQFDPANPNITRSAARKATDTPGFKRWFGDSKVVDSRGDPLVVYHGSPDVRDIFSSGFKARHRGSVFFAAKDYAVADSYADDRRAFDYQNAEPQTIPLYLSIKNPMMVDAKGAHWKETERFVDEAKAAGHDGIIISNSVDFYNNPKGRGAPTTVYAWFDPTQAKSAVEGQLRSRVDRQPIPGAVGNNGQFDPSNPDITKSLPRIPGLNGGPVERTTGDYGREYTPQQLRMFKNVGRTTSKPALIDRLKEARKDLGKKMAQGIVDQFRPIRELGGNAYTLARLSKGAAGAFEALLGHGKLKIVDGAYDADTTGGFLDLVGKPLGKELEDFMFWVASNRAESLSLQDRENLFTQEDIDAGKSLADGDLEFDYLLANGATTRDRRAAYEDALKKFNGFNKNVLDIAEQSGLIDGESRKFWEGEFYVPFYRVSEEDGEFVGAKIKGGLARQRAFHELKGGSQKLNSDLLANTMRNWAHLIDASAKNRAAKATLEAAQSVGVALESDAETVRQLGKSMGGKGGTVWFMDGGQQRHFLVGDPYLLEAINSLEYAGLRGPLMDALSTMKHWLTVGVTASPAFKVRNLIRDSIQAISISGLSYNPVKNLVEGYKSTDRASQDYVSALASGGLIRFGTMLEGNAAERVRRLVQKGVPASTILNTPGKVKDFYGKFVEPAVEAYQELGNRGEEINRASLYKQLRAQGINHAEASLMARDLMDFSMQGTWTSIRFLTQVVPFLNARLQGLYKLGRGAAEDPKRFAMVAGATAMVSIALLGAYGDDDDWKKREDWDRDGFWWFKFGGTAFRIPKPFEVGALATLAERGVELFTNDEFTAKRFGSRVMHLLGDNLAMNPIPQAVKPMLDIYANKDSFSGRPIESMGMERLQSEYRYNVNTSMVARGASSALNAVTRTVGADSLSPVQIDSLIRGYFGWLGTFVVAGADMAVRPLTSEPARPQADYLKVVTQGFLKTLPEPSSKYVSAMYDQAKILEQAFATHRQMIKEGKLDEAREFAAENKDLLERYRLIESVKKTQSNINRRIREIEISDMDPARKREEIQKLRDQADRSARTVY